MDKVAFHIDLTIHWYGVLVALGFLAALWTASRRALRENVSPDTILDFGPWAIVGAIVGARFLYVISYWKEQFAGKPFYEVFMVHHGGLVFYGGLLGAALATVLFARRRKLPLWQLADILAPSIALGHVFGRFGCLMNGCCYGHASSMPWAIRFPGGHETLGVAVHPTQIYEAMLNLGLYGALAWLFRRKQFDGQVFSAYLIGYAVLRSFVEIFRGDYPPGARYLGDLATPAQLVSMATVIIGLLLLWKLPRRAVAAATVSNKSSVPKS